MPKKQRCILFTFDYELFLGRRSGSVINCLIKPTDIILRILRKHGVKGIFFIDTTYLIRLKEKSIHYNKAQKDWELIEQQLQAIATDGHSLYLHIHPHWLDAVYDGSINEWNLESTSHFAFSNLSEAERGKIFAESYTILTEIISPVKKPNIQGFRAGGLYMQPFADFKPYFKEFNIKYDFSVFPGFKSQGTYYGYDYINAVGKLIYNFENDLLVEEVNGNYTEFIIPSIEIKNIIKVINGILYRFSKQFRTAKQWGDGLASVNKINHNTPSNLFYTRESFSIEMMNHIKLVLYLNHIKKNHFCQLISHPKFISLYNIQIFDKFLIKLWKRYDLITDEFQIEQILT